MTLLARYWYVAVIAGLVAIIGIQGARIDNAKRETAELRESYATAERAAEVAARAEETRRQESIDVIAQTAQAKIDEAMADAASAHLAADGLRDAAASAASRGRSRAGTAAPSAPAGDPIGVLAVVLGRADERAGILADYADRSRIAGQACVDAYSALVH